MIIDDKNELAQKINTLRTQAESIKNERDTILNDTNNGELIALLHELDVYKIELELQNEELVAAYGAISESEQRFRDLYENAPVSYFTLDSTGVFIESNLKFCEILGIDRNDIYKLKLADVVHSNWTEAYNLLMFEMQNTGNFKGELCLIDVNNKNIVMQVESVSVYGKKERKEELFRFALIDITEMSQTEKAFQRSQKMESLGVLAGGVAHDFNNVLATIIGYIDLTQLVITPDHEVYQLAEKIKRVSLHGKKLVDRILTFCHNGLESYNVIEILPCIRIAVQIMEDNLPENIRITLNLPERSPRILADADQIQQVIFNLLSNAVQATPKTGGNINLSLQEFIDSEKKEFVVLTVSDSGSGMSEKELNAIFDPFYTTKKLGEGTGLGLTIADRIIKKHKGEIKVKSALGKGSEFKIFLPVSAFEPNPKHIELDYLNRGPGHVLLIDDETELTELYQTMLKLLGFNVTAFDCSLTALNYFKYHANEIDLILTDLNMPNMSGKELILAIQSTHKDKPIIAMTGYCEEFSEKEALNAGVAAYINKPFDLKELSKAINTTIKQLVLTNPK